MDVQNVPQPDSIWNKPINCETCLWKHPDTCRTCEHKPKIPNDIVGIIKMYKAQGITIEEAIQEVERRTYSRLPENIKEMVYREV